MTLVPSAAASVGRRSTRAALGMLVPSLLLFTACGGDGSPTPVEPEPTTAGIRAVAGATVDDTVLAQPVQALVVEVRGPGGVVARGVTVRFEARPPADSLRRSERAAYVCALASSACGPASVPNGPASDSQFAADTTDAQGRARVLLRLGTVAGASVVAVSVPELALRDSVTLKVRPGSAAALRFAVRDTAVYAGAQVPLGASVRDRFGNARPDAVTLIADGTIAQVAPGGVATALAIGRATIRARAGAASDPAMLSVIPQGRIVAIRMSTYPFAVVLSNLDGSDQRTIATTTGANGVSLVWNADRNSVLYHEGGSTPYVVIVDTLGGGPRRLVTAPSLVTSQFPRAWRGGSSVYFQGFDGQQFSLWQADPAGASPRRITNVSGHTGFNALEPSPDGTQVLTSRAYSSTPEILTLATGTWRSLPIVGSINHWSPDGQWIGFISGGSGTPYGAVGLIRPDGSGLRVLTPSLACTPAPLGWSPDGQWVICRGASALQLVRMSDGLVLPLTLRTLEQPAWR